MVDRADVLAAAGRIDGWVRRTPTIGYGGITLKLELLQHTGSFKPRGTFNRVLSEPIGAAGLIAASGGNHGAAVAYAARELGCSAEIFVPTISSPTKVARLRQLGAHVHIEGRVYAEALVASQARQSETGALAVHAYDDPLVVAGQGTVASELAEQSPSLETVLVAVGGGGLAAGISAYYGDSVQVTAVETEQTNAFAAALSAGRPVQLAQVGGPAADSLGASSIGDIAFEILVRNNVQSLIVSDDDVASAQRLMWDQFRLIVEPGGATALAAILAGRYQPAAGERVGVIVCGANADPMTIVS